MENNLKIPRIIHYCWFGGNPLPESAKKCIESWKHFCPDYEIKCWDESNYDVNSCTYTAQAYAAGKWAFVSDYARFEILYTHGGVYFDTDVEMVRPIDDILERGSFFGVEQGHADTLVAPGLGMAATPGHSIYKRILESYNKKSFLNPDGTYNQTTVVKYTTDILREYGLKDTQEIQCVGDIWIYPWDYFCPVEYQTGELTLTENTRTIHHYSASWLTKDEQNVHRVTQKFSKLLGEKTGKQIGRLYGLPYRIRKKIQEIGFRKTVGFAFRKLLRGDQLK